MQQLTHCFMLLALTGWLASCSHVATEEQVRSAELPPEGVPPQRVVIGVEQQKMVIFDWKKPKKMYPVSTSKFGLGNQPGSWKTPVGQMEVVKVIGKGLVPGSRLKARQPTGEVVPVNAPGRDAIVTRVLILKGAEKGNANTRQRFIYIHGTPAEDKLESPASWGCIRMASTDIIELCEWLRPGARVDVVPGRLPPPDDLPN